MKMILNSDLKKINIQKNNTVKDIMKMKHLERNRLKEQKHIISILKVTIDN